MDGLEKRVASMTSRRVLVLDGDWVQALDIVRCLGKAGLLVTVGASSPHAIACKSRYARACLTYPNPERSPALFVDWLEETLRTTSFDMVVPVTDFTVIPLSRHAARLQRLSVLATESWEKLEAVCDKDKTIALARSLGVPVPATSFTVCHADDLGSQARSLIFPVVCKPTVSIAWSDSGFHKSSVFYALDADQLLRELKERTSVCPVMVQQYTKGIGVGLEVLARNGDILQAFQHRRLHELPLTGGGSTYRMSVPVDPLLLEYARRLLGALHWTGVAMVEFKVDPLTQHAVLMEVNGRFWGSLPLASRAGMRFATDLYRMLVLGETPGPRRYVPGVRCRRLRDDLVWFKEMLLLDRRYPLVAAGLVQRKSLASLLLELARVVAPAERYDVQVLRDPVPGLWDLTQTGVAFLSTLRRKIAAALRTRQLWCYRLLASRRLKQRLRNARRLLFVCHGNIMRSPFASAYVHRRMHAAGLNIEVLSAGVHNRGGRPADARAVAVARRWDIDLTGHRSRVVDDDLVSWADVILAMDHSNLRQLRTSFPGAAGKSYLLGVLDHARGAHVEISDPFNAGELALEVACKKIVAAIEVLVASMGLQTAEPSHRSERRASAFSG